MVGRLMFDTPKFELHANNGPLETRTAIAMMIVCILGVVGRLCAKRIIRQPYAWDDVLIIISLLCSWSLSIMEILAVKSGHVGQHVALLKSNAPLTYLNMYIYIEQIVYIVSIALTKFSLTIFYRRLFGMRNSKTMTWLLYLEWFLGFRLIATIIANVVPCLPIESFWDQTMHGKCINVSAYLISLAITNIATDIILLVFPIPIVWNLHIARSQKIAISIPFLLGSIVILISVLRFAAVIGLVGTKDYTWAFFPFALWTTMETNIAIFCVCIPVMRPLLNLFPGQKVGPRNGNGTNNRQGHKNWWPSIKTTAAADDSANFRVLHGDDSLVENLNTHGFQTLVSANKADPNEGVSVPVPTDVINVERTIEWH